jgi:hypothetical protein
MPKMILFFCVLFSLATTAQVGIGTSNPQATLDIFTSNPASPSETEGILIPRIDEFPAVNPGVGQDGMMVFATGNGSVEKGLYYWDHDALSWISFLTVGVERINDLLDGKSDLSGSSLFVGLQAGESDNGGNNQNTGVGFQALNANISATDNTAFGHRALWSLETGIGENTAIGVSALSSTPIGRQNVAIGWRAMVNAGPDVRRATAIGYQAMSESTGGAGTAVGIESMRFTTTGSENAALGNRSLYSNTTGDRNTAIGHQAMLNNTTANRNTAMGYQALSTNTTGGNNAAFGYQTLGLNEQGNDNVALGYHAGRNITGSQNVVIGRSAGRGEFDVLNPINGNVFIGYQAGYFETNSNRLFIENSDANETGALIYGEFDNDLLRFNAAVGIGRNAATNALEINGEASKTTAGAFVANSDRRLKKNIQTIAGKQALQLIEQMHGVTYEWNDNITGNNRPDGIQYGFIAQELQTVFPEKVTEDAMGYFQTAYGDYDALFVQAIKALKQDNEALKKQVSELKTMIERLLALEAMMSATQNNSK